MVKASTTTTEVPKPDQIGSETRGDAGSDPGNPTTSLARFYMTSDLRAATGLTRTHLDFYLREGVIVPTARTESGYLLFDDDELAVLRKVISWRQEGHGVREIRAQLGRLREDDAT